MEREDPCARTPIDRFAWQYSFYAHLIYRKSPTSQQELSDLSQALYVFKGHLSPIETAEAVLLSWPFDVTTWGRASLGGSTLQRLARRQPISHIGTGEGHHERHPSGYFRVVFLGDRARIGPSLRLGLGRSLRRSWPRNRCTHRQSLSDAGGEGEDR